MNRYTDEAWEGKYGKQAQAVEVALQSGRKLKKDYVILSAGTNPNNWIVGQKDMGALDGKFIRCRQLSQGEGEKKMCLIIDV